MLMSIIHAGTMLTSVVLTATSYYRQRNTCCSCIGWLQTHKWQWKPSEAFNPRPNQRKRVYLDRKPLRRALKNYSKNADIQLFTDVGFWKGERKGLSCAQEDVGSLTIHQWKYGQYKLYLTYLGSEAGVGGWTSEEWEVSVIRMHYLKIPNNQ